MIFLAVILRISGIISFTILDLLNYLFMFAGISAVFSSFGKERKGILFSGSTLFLIGIVIYVTSKFDLEEARQIVFLSVLFIIGVGFLLLFIDSTSQKIYLVFSLFFIACGLLYIVFLRRSVLSGFADSLLAMVKSYWLILLVIAGFILLLRRKS